MENSSLRLQVPPLAGAVLQDQIYGSGWAFLRPEDVTGAHDPYGQVAGDLVRCALVERHLDLLVLGPLSDLRFVNSHAGCKLTQNFGLLHWTLYTKERVERV